MFALPLDQATDMNDSGLIVGSKNGLAAVYVNGAVQMLASPQGYTDVVAWAVSSNGIIVGSGMSAGHQRPLRWSSYQAPGMDIGSYARYTQPTSVNASGVIVGYTIASATSSPRAFRYSSSTGMVDIHPAGWDLSQAFHISNSGYIAGFTNGGNNEGYAARWYPSGAVGSIARGTGNRAFEDGRILGTAFLTSGGQSARIWDLSNTVTLVGPSPTTHFVNQISAAGRMVGVTNDSRAWTTINGSTTPTYLPVPAGNFGAARRVTSCGAVLGSYGTTPFNFRPVLWTRMLCDQSVIVAAP
jgi:probable HAF family extracellular repeat protein